MSCRVQMCGCDNLEIALASRSSRCRRTGSEDKLAGSTLIATSRSRRVSRARYTSPMPPAPSGETISYGPSLVPTSAPCVARHHSPRVKEPITWIQKLGTRYWVRVMMRLLGYSRTIGTGFVETSFLHAYRSHLPMGYFKSCQGEGGCRNRLIADLTPVFRQPIITSVTVMVLRSLALTNEHMVC
jgi:hypothetical protein